MLIVYHYDSKTDAFRRIQNLPLKLQLGFFPKKTARIALKMVSWAVDKTGGPVYLEFPDVRPRHIEEEIIDAADAWELPGFGFETGTGAFLSHGVAQLEKSSDTVALDLDLGFMDPQKDFFTVIVNSRFGNPEATDIDNLNNLSLVFEMHDVSAAT
jgi:hypothetical protein